MMIINFKGHFCNKINSLHPMKTLHPPHVTVVLDGVYLNKKVRSALTAKNQYGFIYIDGGKWTDLGLPSKCSGIKEWTVQKLWLEHNEEPKILKHIDGIIFSSLTNLRLTGNKIASLENLSNLMMPFLENLDLTMNHINRLSTLKKTRFPNIKKLELNGNKINECQALQEMENWNIEQISLDAYAHKDVLSENLGWIFRLSGDKLKIVGIRSKRRISEKTKKNQIKGRYSGIIIHSRY